MKLELKARLIRRRPTPKSRDFSHADDCKIVKADPDVKIPWSEVETGHWVAECQCGKEHIHDTPADSRVRLDPFDPSTSRHAPQCERRDTSDPALLRAILKVREGADEGYWWVECSACDDAWQVPYYAAASVG